MTGFISRLPFFVLLLGIGAAAMMVPAAHGLAIRDHATSRAFFYSSLLFLVLFWLIAIATSNTRVRRQGRAHLIALVGAYTALPAMLAFPVAEATAAPSFFDTYFEMVSSLTTTGATLFDPETLPPSVHLWRAIVGWMGGLLVWITAAAVLAPLNLGGFEVRSDAEIGLGAVETTQIARVADMSHRVKRFTGQLFPIYVGLTVALWAALFLTGATPLVAISHAMSVVSTSGISPVGGIADGDSNIAGEAIILVFFLFAISRVSFVREERVGGWRSLGTDAEIRLGLTIIIVVPLLLFLRHWSGAIELAGTSDFVSGLRSYWGGLFTVASFLSTTGFESTYWESAMFWSNLGTPGLILMGLAVLGGGVGTTAGGVKLLRVYALYQHGLREMQKLGHPSSIGGAGPMGRKLRRQGAYVAWVFFMLFAITIAAVMAALAVTGLNFEDSLVLTIAALSTTGPLVHTATEGTIELQKLPETAKAVMAFAMVVGRLETLAIIALLNPNFWRT